MKKYLFIALVLLALNVNATNYRVHACTNNSYGNNYAIELIVSGEQYSYGSRVDNVYYWNGEEYISLEYHSDIISNRYWVFIGGNRYYFSL